MADSEFEQFRHIFDRNNHHGVASAPYYSLVPIVGLEEDSPSNSSGESTCSTGNGGGSTNNILGSHNRVSSGDEDDEEPIRTRPPPRTTAPPLPPWNNGTGERKRRKLPEIPKTKKSNLINMCPPITNSNNSQPASLAEELAGAVAVTGRPLLVLKCGYLLDEDSSPDSERPQSLGDVDSGHSTAHSPTDTAPKSMSPTPVNQITRVGSMSPLSTCSTSVFPFSGSTGGISFSQLEMLEATHRGLHKFIPRHCGEIEVEIGDPLYVQKEAEDLWCEGVNLRTGRQGIFPSAYAVDMEYNDFDPSNVQAKRERYLLGYLGSVETLAHKGTSVVCQAVKKIVGDPTSEPPSQSCILEVSDQGLRMVDRSKPGRRDNAPCIDYFYSLKNVSFCAFHPRDHRYLGFITKHPTLQRFACHVFRGHDSTRPVAEAVGRAFQRFYQKFIETAYPVEDIYIE